MNKLVNKNCSQMLDSDDVQNIINPNKSFKTLIPSVNKRFKINRKVIGEMKAINKWKKLMKKVRYNRVIEFVKRYKSQAEKLRFACNVIGKFYLEYKLRKESVTQEKLKFDERRINAFNEMQNYLNGIDDDLEQFIVSDEEG